MHFVHSVEIDRPAEVVFAFLGEPENNPRWQDGMVSCAWTSETHGEVGSTYAQTARFLGRDIETHFVVTEAEGLSVRIESTKSTFPIQVTRRVEALGPQRCRVTADVAGQPTGLMKWLSFLAKGSIRKDYARLQALLESES